jgi:hypothetical protein
MNTLFGDATSVMPTPETLAEAESLFSASRSPVPSLDIHRAADGAIPGLDIDPPVRPSSARQSSNEGVGGWISNMVARARGEERDAGGGYKRVGQGGEEDEGE